MVRGKMYWSRSMYDMLGYKPCDTMLSFGEVDEIIHPEDGDLFELANRIVAREIDHIDQVFRMRHADGQWVWMRARAQVIDPEAPEIQLIGIAVDVTEQRHLALRSEAADLRLQHRDREHQRILRAVGFGAAPDHVQFQIPAGQRPVGSRRDAGHVARSAGRAHAGLRLRAAACQRQRTARRRHLRAAACRRPLAAGQRVEDPRRRHRLGRLRHHPDQAASGEAGRQRTPADGDDPRPQPRAPGRAGALDANWSSSTANT